MTRKELVWKGGWSWAWLCQDMSWWHPAHFGFTRDSFSPLLTCFGKLLLQLWVIFHLWLFFIILSPLQLLPDWKWTNYVWHIQALWTMCFHPCTPIYPYYNSDIIHLGPEFCLNHLICCPGFPSEGLTFHLSMNSKQVEGSLSLPRLVLLSW